MSSTTSRRPRSRRRSRDRDPARADPRDLLIDATLRLLVSRPVAGVSVRDIAAEAGGNHGLVHRHFRSHDHLPRAPRALSPRAPPPARAPCFAGPRRAPPAPGVGVARPGLAGPAELLAIAAPPPELLRRLAARLAPALEQMGALTRGGADVYIAN